MVWLDVVEARERIEEMRRAAFKLKLYASIMHSVNPRKQKAIEKVRECVDEVIESLEVLDTWECPSDVELGLCERREKA